MVAFAWLSAATPSSSAGLATFSPLCWAKDSNQNREPPTDITPALDTLEATSGSTGATPTQSRVFEFDDGADSTIICQFMVPIDYDATSSTKPKVLIGGWSSECVLCSSGTAKVRFEVESFGAQPGFTVNGSWATAATVDRSWTCTTSACGAGSNGYPKEVFDVLEVNGTSTTGLWAPGYMVWIKITRDTAVSGNLGSPYWVSDVVVKYPTP